MLTPAGRVAGSVRWRATRDRMHGAMPHGPGEPSAVTSGHGEAQVVLRTLAAVTGDLRAAIQAAGSGLWAAPHLSGTAPRDAVFRDVVPLATGALVIWSVGEELLVAPVVADGPGVRRAAVGDGVFAAIAAALDGSRPVAETGERIVGVDQTNESVGGGD